MNAPRKPKRTEMQFLRSENVRLRAALSQLLAASDDDGSNLSAMNLVIAQNAARAALSK